MGYTDWTDWSLNYKTSFFNPTLKIITLAAITIAIVILILARIRFKEFKDLKIVIEILIISSIVLFLGFFFRLLGDFIIIWKWLESIFNFIAAMLFLFTAFIFIFKIIKTEKIEFKIDLVLIVFIAGAIYAVIFWSILAQPSISTSSLSLEYEESFLNYFLKLIGSLAFLISSFLFLKGRKKYSEKLDRMILILVIATFSLYLGSLCRDHGLIFGFTKEYSLKWFQSIFYTIGTCLMVYTSYLFYDTGKKFQETLKSHYISA